MRQYDLLHHEPRKSRWARFASYEAQQEAEQANQPHNKCRLPCLRMAQRPRSFYAMRHLLKRIPAAASQFFLKKIQDFPIW